MPKAMISFRHAELEGAAVALVMDEKRREVSNYMKLTLKSGVTVGANVSPVAYRSL
jgi:hypothetical protein